MQYAEIAPHGSLSTSVRCYWLLSGSAADDAAGDPAFPDGSPELIFNLADPFVAIAPDGSERTQPAVFLVGQITRPFRVRPTGRIDLVGVRLEAHGATWLVDDLTALTDDFVDVAAHADGALESLHRALSAARTESERVSLLNAGLAPLLGTGRQADPRAAAAVRAIRASHGLRDIAEIAAELSTTPRTLQRLFARDVGIAPKQLARMVRFQRVFAAWRESPSTLARVAAECGYFDHAHLVRDFRELAGVAPARFLPNQPEFTRFFTS